MSTAIDAARTPSEASPARMHHQLSAERRPEARFARQASVSFPAVRETRRERSSSRAPVPGAPATRREAAPGRSRSPDPPADGIERLVQPDDARKEGR